MKSLTVGELKTDKAKYREVVADLKEELEEAQQRVVSVTASIHRAEGAWRYVGENLKKIEDEEAKRAKENADNTGKA